MELGWDDDTERDEGENYGERSLWATLIHVSAYRAMNVGEGTSIAWFKERNGQFALLCSYLNLPEQLLREYIVSRSLKRLNEKRQINVERGKKGQTIWP